MTTTSEHDATGLLRAWRGGDAEALNRLTPLVYAELKRIARGRMAGERKGHTLQVTALVNEAYLKLIDVRQVEWRSRAQFCAIASTIMRRILIDYARRRNREIHGGRVEHIPIDKLDREMFISPEKVTEWIALDEALDRLAVLDARMARVVELRHFGGLTVKETAEVLGVSPRTVEDDWAFAKDLLLSQLGGNDADAGFARS